MKKLLAAGIMLAFTSLNAQMLSFGLRGGVQRISNEGSENYPAIGLFATAKPPLINAGFQISADYFGKKSEIAIGFCERKTKILALDASLFYNVHIPTTPLTLYFGIGGGIQSWTTEVKGFECGNSKDTDNHTDVHALLGTRVKPPLSPVGAVFELKYSKVFLEDDNLNDLGFMGGLYFGF
ncbi:MAG TPA: hypothetical protein ENG67_04455 [candidate division WOR-3 bacterium]|uniref:Outer membrane protein beta-barrel domain-containing protein n=1 Tax=candidate division WOR-3 bacterium TaxID=2052148 RepID=A0A7C0XBA2_UNCW3|nr:hypothetical protein [candidate division WOR-3 bacterium]